MHTIIVIVLTYAALRAIFKRRPAAYKMQTISRHESFTPAARDSGSTIPAPTFELWSVTAARYEAQRQEVARNALAMYTPSHLEQET
jgi:hypothetical protein